MIVRGAMALLAFGAKSVINYAGAPIFNGVANRTLPRIVACRRAVQVAVVAIGQAGMIK